MVYEHEIRDIFGTRYMDMADNPEILKYNSVLFFKIADFASDWKYREIYNFEQHKSFSSTS